MAEQNHLKTRIRRILRSCMSKDVITADVAEGRHRRQRFHLSELFSPVQPARGSSLSYPLLAADEDGNGFITDDKIISPCHVEGRKCPPSSPINPPVCNTKHSRKKKTAVRSASRRPTASYYKNNNGFYQPDSLAVVKRSRDPYIDFRASMVEMIVEKQMFGAEDLENLLECFLWLNAGRHHQAIIQAFAEIWEALLL